MGKLQYLQKSVVAQFDSERFDCPNCGSARSRVVDSKYLITKLRRCDACRMMFRTPTDKPEENADFYDAVYTQGFTTDAPSDADLEELKRSNFGGTERDYGYYIDVLRSLGIPEGARLFDFGCSWGYGSYQLRNAGFDVLSFEVAAGRKRYAVEKLGVRMADDMNVASETLAGTFDCFFSAHVLEHVPSPAESFAYARKLLKPDGMFVSFTPNGSATYRQASPEWSKLWGEVHPNFLDDVFLDASFKGSPRVIGSSPVAGPKLPAAREMVRADDLGRYELFFAARKQGDAWA